MGISWPISGWMEVNRDIAADREDDYEGHIIVWLNGYFYGILDRDWMVSDIW